MPDLPDRYCSLHSPPCLARLAYARYVSINRKTFLLGIPDDVGACTEFSTTQSHSSLQRHKFVAWGVESVAVEVSDIF